MTGTPHRPIFSRLDLHGRPPLIAGGERLIFQHPGDPRLLVKVMDERVRLERRAKHPIKHWHKRFQRAAAYRGYISELSEYIASQGAGEAARDVPLARSLGLVQTTLGLGLLVEKIADEQGGLAPTLAELVKRRGLDDALREELRVFFHALADAHVVLNDLSAANVVCGINANGRKGLYLIDGFGNKQAIPLFAMSKALNRRRIMRKYGELLVKLERLDRERQPDGAGVASSRG